MNNLYREWLLGLVIKVGIGKSFDAKDNIDDGWQWWSKAQELNHLIYFDNDDGRVIGYCLTPKAAEYLERYDDK